MTMNNTMEGYKQFNEIKMYFFQIKKWAIKK
jgi:hypothetical protein